MTYVCSIYMVDIGRVTYVVGHLPYLEEMWRTLLRFAGSVVFLGYGNDGCGDQTARATKQTWPSWNQQAVKARFLGSCSIMNHV
jgi:hypothetical protein